MKNQHWDILARKLVDLAYIYMLFPFNYGYSYNLRYMPTLIFYERLDSDVPRHRWKNWIDRCSSYRNRPGCAAMWHRPWRRSSGSWRAKKRWGIDISTWQFFIICFPFRMCIICIAWSYLIIGFGWVDQEWLVASRLGWFTGSLPILQLGQSPFSIIFQSKISILMDWNLNFLDMLSG